MKKSRNVEDNLSLSIGEEAAGNYLAQVRMSRSAPPITRLSRFFAGEAAPKEENKQKKEESEIK